MTAWALWDRLVPLVLLISACVMAFLLGRGWERVDWLNGKRSCGHDPDCSIRSDFDAGLATLDGIPDPRRKP